MDFFQRSTLLCAATTLVSLLTPVGYAWAQSATTPTETPVVQVTAGTQTVTYGGQLELAIAGMEEGKHIQALGPLRTALALDRNEPYGILALGTLYLHANSPTRAAREFERAQLLAPDEPLAKWGLAMAALESGKCDPASFETVPATVIPEAAVVALYARLMSGPAADIEAATKDVTATEMDPLKLQIAGVAAIRAGDIDRGIALLTALVARPDMKILTEDRAVVLPFQVSRPAEGEAPTLPDAIGFPDLAGGMALTGVASLSPPNGVPAGTSLVTYTSPGGGGFTASTNAEPFVAPWSTAKYPNGLYTLRTVAYDATGKALSDVSRTVTLSNPNAPVSALLNDDQRVDFRRRLRDLLTPRVCRKAAHYALAARAGLRGDKEIEENESEAVVAIDPGFGDSLKTLHELHEDLILHPENWWRAETNEKIVAMTFDDGPNPAPPHTPALLAALRKAGAHGTFFVVGARAEQNTDLLKEMIADGHEIANHSYSHPNLTYLDHNALERELCRTSVVVRQATGQRPRFYRPPGGNYNSAVIEAAGTLGMAGAYWTIDGVNFETGPFPPEKLVNFILSKIRPGAIILMHNAPENTVAAIPAIVAGIRAKGYEMVTMSELARRARAGGTGSTGAHDANAMTLPTTAPLVPLADGIARR